MDIDGITSSLSIENLIFAACRGRWPASLNAKSDKAKLFIAKDYLNIICDEDISRVDDVKRNPTLARLIRQKNETEKQVPLREPDLMIVITGGEFAYTREDGVKVIPLGCLKD